MLIWWDTSKTPGGGGGEGSSIDPGPENVKKGKPYNINGNDRVGLYDLFIVNTNEDNDIVSMSVEALANFLKEQITGMTVIEEWPYANQQLTYPTISIFTGKAKRMPLMPEIMSVSDPDGENKVTALEVVAEYDFTLQLDLWTRNKLERKQNLAKLLTAFNFAEVDDTGSNNSDGLTLVLANYHDMPVRYEIDTHQHKDDEAASQRQERRETIMVIVNLREIRSRTYYAMRQIETHTGVGSTDAENDDLESNQVPDDID